MFLFHKNKSTYSGAKVRPPRLNGAKMGLFATRSPHRPNPVGLTLAQIDRIEGNVIHLLGVDIITGTPVIDIKPYIPQYDMPLNSEIAVDETLNCRQTCYEDMAKTAAGLKASSIEVNQSGCCDDTEASSIIDSDWVSNACQFAQYADKPEVTVASWVKDTSQSQLSVLFTARADQQLKQFSRSGQDASLQLRHLETASELRSALTAVLEADPRSAYRRKHCLDQLYYVTVDVAHVTCWFDADTVEVLKVESVAHNN